MIPWRGKCLVLFSLIFTDFFSHCFLYCHVQRLGIQAGKGLGWEADPRAVDL